MKLINKIRAERLFNKLGYKRDYSKFNLVYYKDDKHKDIRRYIEFRPWYETISNEMVVDAYTERYEKPDMSSEILCLSIPLTKDEIKACYLMIRGLT